LCSSVYQKQQLPQPPKPGKPKPLWKKPKWWNPKPKWWKPLWKPNGKACALVAANGPDANSTITAAIATMLRAIPVFEFIKIRYGRLDNKDDDESHYWVSFVVFVIHFI
jgi:hypothetical protein